MVDRKKPGRPAEEDPTFMDELRELNNVLE